VATRAASLIGPWADLYAQQLAYAFSESVVLESAGRIIPVGCRAHARREFADVRLHQARVMHYLLGLIKEIPISARWNVELGHGRLRQIMPASDFNAKPQGPPAAASRRPGRPFDCLSRLSGLVRSRWKAEWNT
jgi:hypothetical protein